MLSFAIAMFLVGTQTMSHEFWISPESYTVNPGESIVADIRVGAEFSGAPSAFIPDRFERFDLIKGGNVRAVTGRMGDRPALNMPAGTQGLLVVVHETKDSKLTYTSWEQFAEFVGHKNFDGVLEQHQARDLPDQGFSERFRRFAKALISVGEGEGKDSDVGMRTEIIALKNPYTDDLAVGLPLRVLFEGLPRVNAQVEVFSKTATGLTNTATYQTNDQGEVTIAVKPGTEYLVDAVVMLPLENQDADKGAVWESLWASLTFRIPE